MTSKHLILLGFLPLFITGLRAQQSPISQAPIGQSRWSVSLLAGAAIPVGKFGGKSLADSTQSFAQIGPSINLQLNYRLHAGLGLSLLLSGQQNTVNTSAMEEEIEKANPDEITYISSGKWSIGKIMAGPTLALPIGKGHWELTIKGMAGVLKTSEPSFNIVGIETYYSGSGSLATPPGSISFGDYTSKRPVSWAFAWLGGAGLRFLINSRWSFLTDIDYSAATIKTPYLRSSSAMLTPLGGTLISYGSGLTPPFQPVAQRYFSIPVTSLSAHFGMEFRF